MILNLGSIEFNANIASGGGTPAWGTEMGQGEGHKFSFENMDEFFTAMVYNAIEDCKNRVFCPLGKGGNKQDDYKFVLASLFSKVYVNDILVPNARFLLLIVELKNGEFHVGRRTLKYNANITLDGEKVNDDCYTKIKNALKLTEKSTWFISEIRFKNQDELHFTAHILDKKKIVEYATPAERKHAFLSVLDSQKKRNYILLEESVENHYSSFRPYLAALKSKPFLLLAGISGTGKSRIVRELARACWDKDSDEYRKQKPRNFEMVQVKPNWHDSYELFGYVSRVSGKPIFVVGDFLRFVARAWAEPEIPYFLCLDEMNLAPVEQYFAEFLSVIESRKCNNGVVTTDPILRKEDTEWFFDLTASIAPNEEVRERFKNDGICLPQNLIVVGTVNMDETTFSFSRKVLDRAMTIEMNEVDLHGGLSSRHERIGKLGAAELIGTAVEGVDVYEANKEVCDIALNYLQAVNDVLNGTPFKIAYRTRNEFLLYVVNNLPYNKDEEGNELPQGFIIARALDEITNMKILSRIEGDETKVSDRLLNALRDTISKGLKDITDEDHPIKSISIAKLSEMQSRLSASGYTNFWS